jgi:hypothetical protein
VAASVFQPEAAPLTLSAGQHRDVDLTLGQGPDAGGRPGMDDWVR